MMRASVLRPDTVPWTLATQSTTLRRPGLCSSRYTDCCLGRVLLLYPFSFPLIQRPFGSKRKTFPSAWLWVLLPIVYRHLLRRCQLMYASKAPWCDPEQSHGQGARPINSNHPKSQPKVPPLMQLAFLEERKGLDAAAELPDCQMSIPRPPVPPDSTSFNVDVVLNRSVAKSAARSSP